MGVEQRFTAVQKDPAAEGAQQQLAAFAPAEIERIITDLSVPVSQPQNRNGHDQHARGQPVHAGAECVRDH